MRNKQYLEKEEINGNKAYLENIQNKLQGTWEPQDRDPLQNYQNPLIWNIHARNYTYKGRKE